MNATEMGRRSDSLYYDNVSRRELCDRIAHLESDLDAAKNDLSIFSGELVKSKAENAKLRELSHRVCGYIQFMQDTRKRDFELEELIIDMLHGLGIEED